MSDITNKQDTTEEEDTKLSTPELISLSAVLSPICCCFCLLVILGALYSWYIKYMKKCC